jgi:hypothetical protein
VYKATSKDSTEPNQTTNLQVKYEFEHNSVILEFDTTGATASNLKIYICESTRWKPRPYLHTVTIRLV